jgi:ABC-type uncharacterized transport system auxiliary subunit
MSPRRRLLRALPLAGIARCAGIGGLVRNGGVALAAAGGIGGLAGCTVLDNEAPRFDFFEITDLRPEVPPASPTVPAATSAPPAPRVDRTLLLTGGSSPALYDSDRIVYTRDGGSRSYYQYSNWSERPARRILALAESRLAASGSFRAVAQTLAGVRGDLVLSLRLDEILHDVAQAPGAVRVGVTGELVDWRTRTLLSRRSFRQSAPVPTPDAAGTARAASVAVTALLDSLSEWVESSAVPAP